MIEMTLLEKETTERDLREQLTRVTAEKVEAEAQRRRLEIEAEGCRREAREEVERARVEVERLRREVREARERKDMERERYETFRQKIVKEASEVSQRKREEVADTTRRETKREEVKKVELKRVGSLVMKEEMRKDD